MGKPTGLARTALGLLHFDPATGEGNPDWIERCVAACYDCLLSCANPLDHRHLDRHRVRNFLVRLAQSPVKSSGRTYEEQYAWLRARTDPASTSERSFLNHLYERKLRLPDFAQYAPAADVFLQPDFYYQRGAIPGVCVFIDGPHHAGQEVQDRRAREPLEDRGYRIVVITAKRPLAEQIEAFPDIFVPLANGQS